MIGGVTRHMLPYLSGVLHLHINCRFWPHFGTESHYICPFRYESLMVVRKEIYKNCRDVCLSMALFMGQLNFSPSNVGLPQGFNFNFPSCISVTFTWAPSPSPSRVPDNRFRDLV